MALMCSPALLLADEPTTALDVTIQAQVLRLLRDLQGEFDLGMLLITHDLGVVARMSTTVAVMYAGELVETGTRKDIFHAPGGIPLAPRGLLAFPSRRPARCRPVRVWHRSAATFPTWPETSPGVRVHVRPLPPRQAG